jgi:hypothetical protein
MWISGVAAESEHLGFRIVEGPVLIVFHTTNCKADVLNTLARTAPLLVKGLYL